MIKRSPVWDDPRVKPPPSLVTLRRDHPLAGGLRFAWLADAGLGREFVSGLTSRAAASEVPVWSVTATQNSALLFDGTNDNLDFGNHPNLNPKLPWSCVFIGRSTSYGTYQYAIAKGRGGDHGFAFGFANDLDPRLVLVKFSVAVIRTSTFGFGIQSPDDFLGGVSAHSAGVDFVMYSFSAKRFGVESQANAQEFFSAPTEAQIGCGRNGVGVKDNFFRGPLVGVYVWARRLFISDFFWLASEPYTFFQPVIRRRWSIPAAPPGALVFEDDSWSTQPVRRTPLVVTVW